MDGIHDMGGMQGFGKVEPEPNEPLFHAPWEGRALALNRVMGYAGLWTIDQTRYAIEQFPPVFYLTASYYKKWFVRLENMLVERGLVGADELAAGHSLRQGPPLKRKMTADNIEPALNRNKYGRPTNVPAGFKVGDRVRTKNIHPAGAHAAAALCARQDRRGRAGARLPRLSGHRRGRGGREPAMALHRRVRRPRIVGREFRPGAHRVDRGVRALSGAGLRWQRSILPRRAAPPTRSRAFRAMPRGRCSASRGRRRRSRWRSRCTSAGCSPGRNGPRRSADEIKRAQAAGDPDTGETYYHHWLKTLERLVAEKGVTNAQMLARYHEAWDRAADRTPHGQPIELKPEDFAS